MDKRLLPIIEILMDIDRFVSKTILNTFPPTMCEDMLANT